MPLSRLRAPASLTAALAAGALGAATLDGCADATRAVAPAAGAPIAASAATGGSITHVLLLSIDGMHEADLERYVRLYPSSALAQLAGSGIRYTSASTSRPSDSFPGLLSMVTGGTPRSTGVYYDDSYDRRLAAPGSDCSVRGTEVVYDESVDYDPNALNGGGGINPANLPRDPDHGCSPVYPHQFLRVNTIFEVVKAAGLRTAWSDKHPAYDLVNGPSGHGVDDLYTPEIAADGGIFTADAADAIHYDTRKVKAILNEIDGLDHAGATHVGVPAVFGMNFQAVSVGQKTAGYTDANATPTAALATALARTDASIGQMLAELTAQGIRSQTLVIVTAKHGQAPVNPALRRIVSSKLIPAIVDSVSPGLVAQATQDDIALLWLTDQTKTQAAVNALNAAPASVGIQSVLSGAPLVVRFGNPLTDSRTPDAVVITQPGVIYSKVTATKRAEHGGFSDDDAHVPILVSAAGVAAATINTAVTTTQIAPSILQALGLNAQALQAVQIEGTQPLPSLNTALAQRAATVAAVRTR
ncbi:phosphodiesterase [Gemmatimonadetes bacterium T265]|nr:phosphodiesterase [Gemmatimonadetes bacterium T265]